MLFFSYRMSFFSYRMRGSPSSTAPPRLVVEMAHRAGGHAGEGTTDVSVWATGAGGKEARCLGRAWGVPRRSFGGIRVTYVDECVLPHVYTSTSTNY